jgi:hypothetical protein
MCYLNLERILILISLSNIHIWKSKIYIVLFHVKIIYLVSRTIFGIAKPAITAFTDNVSVIMVTMVSDIFH